MHYGIACGDERSGASEKPLQLNPVTTHRCPNGEVCRPRSDNFNGATFSCDVDDIAIELLQHDREVEDTSSASTASRRNNPENEDLMEEGYHPYRSVITFVPVLLPCTDCIPMAQQQ